MHGFKCFRYLLIAVLLIFGKSSAAYNMYFFLPDFPPYTTVDEQGNYIGIGLDEVKPILESVGVRYTIQIGSNHGRALSELRHGRSDGFFMASQNKQRDEYAVFSESVMINRWVWVVLKENWPNFHASAKDNYIMASLLNANTNYWLEHSGYQTVRPAMNITALVGKLNSGKVDAILVAEEVFNSEFANDARYKVSLHSEREFGIYISKAFLKDNPDFMKKLNSAIRERR